VAERDLHDARRRRVMPWTRWNFNHAAALVVAALAAFLYLSIPYEVGKPESLFGRALSALKPTLFPRIVLGTLFVLAVWYLLIAGRLHELNLFRTVDKRGYFNVAVTTACVVAYAFLLPVVGYVAAGVALMLVLTVFYGNRNHLLTVAVSVLVPLAIFYGATHLLQVSLPEFPFL
jgi:hypothetical protein